MKRTSLYFLVTCFLFFLSTLFASDSPPTDGGSSDFSLYIQPVRYENNQEEEEMLNNIDEKILDDIGKKVWSNSLFEEYSLKQREAILKRCQDLFNLHNQTKLQMSMQLRIAIENAMNDDQVSGEGVAEIISDIAMHYEHKISQDNWKLVVQAALRYALDQVSDHLDYQKVVGDELLDGLNTFIDGIIHYTECSTYKKLALNIKKIIPAIYQKDYDVKLDTLEMRDTLELNKRLVQRLRKYIRAKKNTCSFLDSIHDKFNGKPPPGQGGGGGELIGVI